MDGRAPRCAIHQSPVATPAQVENLRLGFAQSAGDRAFFVLRDLSRLSYAVLRKNLFRGNPLGGLGSPRALFVLRDFAEPELAHAFLYYVAITRPYIFVMDRSSEGQS